MLVSIPYFNDVVTAWTIGQEKQYILNSSYTDDLDTKIDIACKTLIPHIDLSKLSVEAKLYYMLIIKCNNTGDAIDVTYTCPHCERVTEGAYNLSDSINFTYADNNKFVFKDHNYEVKRKSATLDNSVHSIDGNTDKEYINSIIDELNFKDSAELSSIIDNLPATSLILTPTVTCMLCGKQTSTFINTIEEIFSKVITTKLQDYYNIEVEFMMHTNFTLDNVHNMLPFERVLYTNLIGAKNNE